MVYIGWYKTCTKIAFVVPMRPSYTDGSCRLCLSYSCVGWVSSCQWDFYMLTSDLTPHKNNNYCTDCHETMRYMLQVKINFRSFFSTLVNFNLGNIFQKNSSSLSPTNLFSLILVFTPPPPPLFYFTSPANDHAHPIPQFNVEQVTLSW